MMLPLRRYCGWRNGKNIGNQLNIPTLKRATGDQRQYSMEICAMVAAWYMMAYVRYGRSMVYDGVCVLLCFGHPTIIRDSLLTYILSRDTMGTQIPDGSMTIPNRGNWPKL